MNFDNCVQSDNHHQNQCIEQSPHPEKLPWPHSLFALSSHPWLLATTQLLSVNI